MLRASVTAFVVALIVGGAPTLSHAAVITDTTILQTGAFDFSEQAHVDDLGRSADILVGFVVDPPLGWTIDARWEAMIVAVPNTAFEDLQEAPADLSLYTSDSLPLELELTYVVRTQEGHYVKFRFLNPLTIEYTYQPDGSRILVDPTPVMNTTWGKLRIIYGVRDDKEQGSSPSIEPSN